MTADFRPFMEQARAMRAAALEAGDQGYGAVIVKDGEIVGWGPSRGVTDRDPTAHAEMEAIRDAAKRLKTTDLSGCVMVSTSRPCPMCETAGYWAHLDDMVFGHDLTKAGKPGYQRC